VGVLVTTGRLLAIAWEWDPSVLLGCAGLVAAYLAAVRWRPQKRALYFFGGLVLLLLTLEGPLDVLGDDYLFSAHMAEHLVLILVVPPLLLLGLPETPVRRLLQRPLFASVERVLRIPLVAWASCIVTLWVWHLPVLYNLTLADESVHIFEHLSFLVTATIFWWPVLAPLEHRRLAPLPAVAYLYTAALANTVLGVLLTFAPVGLYPAYMHPSDELGALHLIRDVWGLDPQADQQLGGLLMWLGGMLAFLWAVMAMLARWYAAARDPASAVKTQPSPTREHAR
jgi:putative membrane protein